MNDTKVFWKSKTVWSWLLVIAIFLGAFLYLGRFFGVWGWQDNTNYNCYSEDCYPTVTPTPSVEPTPTPCIFNPAWKEENPCPTPTIEVTPTLEVTPTSTPEATPIPQGNSGGGGSDGKSDGLGCANHDCNTHKNDAPPAGNKSPFDGQPVGWK